MSISEDHMKLWMSGNVTLFKSLIAKVNWVEARGPSPFVVSLLQHTGRHSPANIQHWVKTLEGYKKSRNRTGPEHSVLFQMDESWCRSLLWRDLDTGSVHTSGGSRTHSYAHLNLASRAYCHVLEKILLSFLSQIRGVFLHWAFPKKLEYGKPRLGESTLT